MVVEVGCTVMGDDRSGKNERKNGGGARAVRRRERKYGTRFYAVRRTDAQVSRLCFMNFMLYECLTITSAHWEM